MRIDLKQIRVVNSLLVAVAVWFLAAGDVVAQAPNPNGIVNVKLKSQRKLVYDALVTGAFEKAADEATFDAYFNDYFLLQFAAPKFSDPDPNEKNPNPLADLRRQLRGSFFGAGKKGPVYDRLHDLTFAMMKAIISPKFPAEPKLDALRYTALKYNAMLMIGDLNKEEPPPQGGKPKPSLDALAYMLQAVDTPTAPDYLRVPALLGIERQAECYGEHPLPADRQQALIKSMLTLFKQKNPGPNRTLEAQVWLRRLAAQILGLIGLPGATGGDEVAVALAMEMRDRKNLLSLRCECAAAFGTMKFSGAEKVDTTEIALDMAVLAYEILIKEEAWVEADEDREPDRRRLKIGLASVAEGLAGRPGRARGIFGGVPEANKKKVIDLIKAVRKTSTLADTGSLSGKDLTKKIEDLEKAFNDPALPHKVVLPKPVEPSKSDPKKQGPPGTNAKNGPLAGRISQ